MSKSLKILIIRFSSIGDIVLITPVLRCLKQQIPDVDIHFCTKRIYYTVLETNPYIDRHHLLDSDIYALIRQLRAENYDYIIDLHNNLRTKLLKLALNVPSYAVSKLNLRKWLYVHFKVNVMPEQHIVDRYLATVLPLGVKDDGLGLDFVIPPVDKVDVRRLPSTHRHGYVAYAIGGQYATKRLPTTRIIELCLKIGNPIILLGGADDWLAGEAVVEAVGSNAVYNACGQYTLRQSASLIQQANVVFCHDTGLMHIAAALKKRIYSIWGNTVPQFGMYPFRTPYTILEKTGLNCRPCSKIGSEHCPAGHFKCMNELPFAIDSNELKQLTNTGVLQITQ
jgi:ADP-heptose:LPS heptosyltransferase